jgi:hypothetical protein
MRICLKKSKDQFIRTSHISLWRRAKDPRLTHFGPLTQFTRDHRTLNHHVPVLDGSYKLPNGQCALPFEMVEVRKGLLTNFISSAARSEHQVR